MSASVDIAVNGTVAAVSRLTFDDVVVFAGLELLGVAGFFGNVLLIYVIFKFGHIRKPSFVLIVNLALADIGHAIVTTGYFYPPIVLKENHVHGALQKLFVFWDWTAWGITITHMSAVCIDRLIAITSLSGYSAIVTNRRAKAYSIACWTFFVVMNMLFWVTNACCNVAPQAKSDFYSFDFVTPLNGHGNASAEYFNVYPVIYVPLEVASMCILLTCTPITLTRLYQRHRRRMAMRQASRLLLHMTVNVSMNSSRDKGEPMSPAEHAASTAVNQVAANHRTARVQQARIFIQITTVTVVFFLYMFVYYLFFYAAPVDSKWVIVLNSVFYSLTNLTNAVVYFACNEDIRGFYRVWDCPRRQVLRAVPCAKWCLRLAASGGTESLRKRGQSTKAPLTASTRTTLLQPNNAIGCDADCLQVNNDHRGGENGLQPNGQRVNSIDEERSSIFCPAMSPSHNTGQELIGTSVGLQPDNPSPGRVPLADPTCPNDSGDSSDWHDFMSELSAPYKDSEYGSPREAANVTILDVKFDDDEILL